MTHRPTTNTIDHLHAECTTCSWQNTNTNGQGPAARHYDATHHPVTVTITHTVRYGAPADQHAALEAAGQTTILNP